MDHFLSGDEASNNGEDCSGLGNPLVYIASHDKAMFEQSTYLPLFCSASGWQLQQLQIIIILLLVRYMVPRYAELLYRVYTRGAFDRCELNVIATKLSLLKLH